MRYNFYELCKGEDKLENIISVIGKVKYSITLDPSVWIFDEGKLDLTTFFDEKKRQSQ